MCLYNEDTRFVKQSLDKVQLNIKSKERHKWLPVVGFIPLFETQIKSAFENVSVVSGKF